MESVVGDSHTIIPGSTENYYIIPSTIGNYTVIPNTIGNPLDIKLNSRFPRE